MSLAPYFHDEQTTLYLGDTLDVLRTMPDESVHCVVTSPPYFGLRDYQHPGQYGHEPTPDQYVARLVAVFTELRRVLAGDGTAWLNLGDSYASGETGRHDAAGRYPSLHDTQPARRERRQRVATGLPPKSLLGMPWRVTLAIQASGGWTLRNAIVWHKPNGMPHSVQDRMSSRYELLFLLVRSRRYWFDLDAVKVPATNRASYRDAKRGRANKRRYAESIGTPNARRMYGANPTSTLNVKAFATRNPGDVWSISTRPYPLAHFATFPVDLPSLCIKAGCRPGGVVLDPFSGAGTTGLAAHQLGHRYVGIDINPEYHDLAIHRLRP